MFPVSSYASMEAELAKREDSNLSTPITVGIILAHPKSQFSYDHIILFLPEYNRRVGKLLNFYMPGYYIDSDCQKPVFSLKGGKYNFNEDDFFQAREILEKKGISLSESPQLILTEYHHHKLRFRNKKTIVINLEASFNSGENISSIFDQLIRISRKTVEYSTFREHYLRQKKVPPLFTS